LKWKKNTIGNDNYELIGSETEKYNFFSYKI
jgi:hypothetical protein